MKAPKVRSAAGLDKPRPMPTRRALAIAGTPVVILQGRREVRRMLVWGVVCAVLFSVCAGMLAFGWFAGAFS